MWSSEPCFSSHLGLIQANLKSCGIRTFVPELVFFINVHPEPRPFYIYLHHLAQRNKRSTSQQVITIAMARHPMKNEESHK